MLTNNEISSDILFEDELYMLVNKLEFSSVLCSAKLLILNSSLYTSVP